MSIKKTIQTAIRKMAGLNEVVQWFKQVNGSLGGGDVTRPYSQSVIVYRCIKLIIDNSRICPLMITDANDREVTSGPLFDLFKRPNRKMSQRKFIEETIGHYLASGEADIVFTATKGLKPSEMTVFGRYQIEDKTRDGVLTGWGLKLPNGRSEPILIDELVQVKNWNPDESLRGLEPWKVCKDYIEQNRKAAIFNNRSLDHNAAMAGILSAQDVTAEQRDQILASLESRHGGYENASKILFLTGGVTWQDSVKDISKMQHAELTKMSEARIAWCYGTPMAMVGDMEQAQLDNLKGSQRIWYYGAFAPVCDFVSAILTEEIAQRFGDYYLWINHKAHPVALEMAQESLSSTGKTMWDMGVPFSDINTWMDLGLPDRPQHEIGWRPVGIVRWDQEEDLGATIPEDEETTNDTHDTNDGKSFECEEKAVEIVKTKIWERWAKSIRPMEKSFEAAMRKYFTRQRKDLLQKLTDLGNGEKSYGQKADSPSADDIMQIIFDVNEENQKLIATVRPQIGQAAAFGASQAHHELGMDMVFGVSDPLPQKIVRRRLPKITLINRDTKVWVRDQIASGLKDGKTVAQIAQDVGSNKAFNGSRAMRIARTETAGAVTQGRFDGFKKAGVPYKTWLSARSGEVRDAHKAADAKYTANPIPMDVPFTVGGEKMMQPGDRSASAKNVVNCRCCLLPVMEVKSAADVAREYSEKDFLTMDIWIKMVGTAHPTGV